MKRRLLLSAILAVLLLLPGYARAELDIIGHYTGGANYFDIATFTSPKGKAAIVGISHKVSAGFSREEWPSFVALWQKARKTKSDSFQFVGTYKETTTTYKSLVTVAAGPGVQFTINDKAGTFIFVLPPSDYAKFDADVAKVTAYLKSN